MCVLSLFREGVFSVEVSTVIFSDFFHHDVISWSFIHSKFFFRHNSLMTSLFDFSVEKFLTSKNFTSFEQKLLMNCWPTNENIFQKNDPGDTSNICVWRSADDVVLPSMQQNIPTKQLSEMLFYAFLKRARQISIDFSLLRCVMVASVCNAIQLLLLTFWEKEWNKEEWEMD